MEEQENEKPAHSYDCDRAVPGCGGGNDSEWSRERWMAELQYSDCARNKCALSRRPLFGEARGRARRSVSNFNWSLDDRSRPCVFQSGISAGLRHRPGAPRLQGKCELGVRTPHGRAVPPYLCVDSDSQTADIS